VIVSVISRVSGVLEDGVFKAGNFLTSLILSLSKRLLLYYNEYTLYSLANETSAVE